MREILFRGKAYNNKWVEGCLITAPNYSYCCILEDEDKVHPMDYPYLDETLGTFDGCATPINPKTICQFTGLTDKNGKKIFEGDIVLWDDDDECVSVIRYDVESAAFVIDEYGINGCLMEYGWDETAGDFGKIETNGFDDYSNLDFEIIGNVFDNPELLSR